MIVKSRTPKEPVDAHIDSVFMRASMELVDLLESTKTLCIDSFGASMTDNGVVDGCYETVFIIEPIKGGLQPLGEVINKWRQMAAPPDLSGC